MGRKALSAAGKVITVLLALILCINLYIIFQKKVNGEEQPLVMGYTYAVVVSGSMEPAIGVDDLVIVHREDGYGEGDVIMYDGGSSYVTHRIIEVREDGYITMGDANSAEDPEVAEEDVTGRVTAVIPGAGRIILFLQTPLGMMLLVAAAILIIEVPYRMDRRRARREEDGLEGK